MEPQLVQVESLEASPHCITNRPPYRLTKLPLTDQPVIELPFWENIYVYNFLGFFNDYALIVSSIEIGDKWYTKFKTKHEWYHNGFLYTIAQYEKIA